MPLDRNGRPYPTRSNARALQQGNEPPQEIQGHDSLEHHLSSSASAVPSEPPPDIRTTPSSGQMFLRVPSRTVAHVDTPPVLRRGENEPGEQQSLFPDLSATDEAAHAVMLRNPNLRKSNPHVTQSDDLERRKNLDQSGYTLAYHGDETMGHVATVYHEGPAGLDDKGEYDRPLTVAARLEWHGKTPHKDYGDVVPGEIAMVKTDPDHQGMGLATSLFDYAQNLSVTRGVPTPVHSKDRSTQGNHWAHFVGGASRTRELGHDMKEY